ERRAEKKFGLQKPVAAPCESAADFTSPATVDQTTVPSSATGNGQSTVDEPVSLTPLLQRGAGVPSSGETAIQSSIPGAPRISDNSCSFVPKASPSATDNEQLTTDQSRSIQPSSL